MKQTLIYLLFQLTILILGCSPADHTSTNSNDENNYFSMYVDEAGNIKRPLNFREEWTHLGTWFVEDNEMASGPGVHDVYAPPESVKAFKKNGQWPDGAIIVKTVSSIEQKLMTTGNAQWAGEINVWFVMVRDRKNRFPNNEAWDEGWGWALFTSDNPEKNLTTNWKGTGFNNCFGCHIPAKNTEWVYIDGYPTIRNTTKYTDQAK